MRAEAAFAMLTEEGAREAIAGISAAAGVSEGFVNQVLLGVRTHPCSAAVSNAVSAWFSARDIDVSPHEVTGMRGVSLERVDDRTV